MAHATITPVHADALPSECHASALCRSPSSSSGWVFANPRSREIESTTNKTLPEHENNDVLGPSKLNPQAIIPIFVKLELGCFRFSSMQAERCTELSERNFTQFMLHGWRVVSSGTIDHTRSSTPRPRQGGDLTLSALTTTDYRM